jgi:folate-binding protein YgfZ
MGITALQGQSGGLGAAAAEYRGATTAVRFGDPQVEFTAYRQGCAVYDLGYRAKLSISGTDRVRWLNGMVTNNIRDLARDSGVYAFLLNPQGRILGDLYAYNRGDSITVDSDLRQLEKLLSTFDHYIIMDDVEVKDLSEEITTIGVAGPKSEEVLKAAGIDLPQMAELQLVSVSCNGVDYTVVRSDAQQPPAFEIWVAPSHVKQVWNRLVAAGATPAGFEALEMQRIVSGVPLYGVDIRERDLPQETEQVRALNFNKGCYVGQEIVERIRSRGAVHRKFTGFLADASVAPGARVIAGDKEVGEITSATSVKISGVDRNVALGYIRREAGVPGREFMIGETKAAVVSMPLTEAAIAQREASLQQRPA